MMILLLELKKAFDKSHRFNNKIFVTKTGPLFASKDQILHKSKEKKRSQGKSEATQHALRPEQLAHDDLKKKRFKETYLNQNTGFTLGVAPSKLNLRKRRKEDYKKVVKSFENIFTNETKERSSEVSSEHSHSSEGETKLRQKEIKTHKTMAADFRRQRTQKFEIVKEIRKKNDSDNKMRVREITENQERLLSNPKIPVYRARSYVPKKKQIEHLPGPASYDVRGNLDLTKGFTFGSKNYKQMEREHYTPDFVLPKTDIEMILDKPKFAESRSERFKEKPIYIPPDAEHICKPSI
jgi:hypothetical protein